jgi:class 3 adenylate cyclase
MSNLDTDNDEGRNVEDKADLGFFDASWSKEFMEQESQLHTAGIACWIVSTFFFFVGVRQNLASDHPWKPVAFCSDQLFGALLMSVASLFTFKVFRTFATEYFNILACCTVALTYMSQLLPHLVDEVHRSQSDSSSFPVKLKIDYSGSWPVRSCNDTDPVETWTSLAMRSQIISCSNSLFSGDVLSQLFSFYTLPFMCKLHHRAAMYITIVLGIIYTGACLLLGSSWGIGLPLAAQLAAGLVTVHYCRRRMHLAKQSFVVVKRTQLTAERNRALIHTFIPKNVLPKLASHPQSQGSGGSAEMLGASIPACTVMFCRLEPQEALQSLPTEDFLRLLHAVFSQLDEQVGRFGMFKYQHVGDWYIVACPRAACPFDQAEQREPYPAQHLASMALLAGAMRAVAEAHRLRGAPLWLRAGIHCGPAVGAVVGAVKAFYCLYGDTVNTAARMCAHAARDHVLASAAFADALRPACPPGVRCGARREIRVKGKGAVPTCRLSIETRPPPAPPSDPVRPDRGGGGGPRAAAEGWWAALRGRAGALAGEAPLEELAGVAVDDLSAEGRAVARGAGYRLCPVRGTFRDAAAEQRFRADGAAEQRASVAAGAALHLLFAALHLVQCARPEHPDGLRARGPGGLAAARGRALAILGAHLALSAACCAALLTALWRDPARCPECRRRLAAVRGAYLVASGLAWRAFPGMWRWNVCYSALAVLLVDTTSPSMRTHGCALLARERRGVGWGWGVA